MTEPVQVLRLWVAWLGAFWAVLVPVLGFGNGLVYGFAGGCDAAGLCLIAAGVREIIRGGS